MTESKTDWKPIETAKLGQEAIFWHPMFTRPSVGVKNGDRSAYFGETDFATNVTHWMPLPDPPATR